jgi:hypothetical protein
MDYDLTSRKDFVKASNWLSTKGLMPVLFSAPYIIKWFADKLLDTVSNEKQIEAAKSLIVAGKENGVKKMKIKVSKKAGIDIGTNVDGLPVKVMAGIDGNVELEVEYS